jgi:diguanylate cyclase (GGDEF)-like protein
LVAAVLQVLFGLLMIISLQWIIPSELIYLTAFLYPIVFVFTYQFHVSLFTYTLFGAAFLMSGIILLLRDIPHFDTYMITTFGSIVIIGQVVKKASEKMLRLANHDSLTGLMNRRHWEENLKYLMGLSSRDNRVISISYLDIDNFKEVNDEFGHARGDELLKGVAAALRNECREVDLIARWGGDEFVIAMPNTDKQQASEMIKRLEMQMKETSFSAGVVTAFPDETVDQLLSRADHAMYKIKLARRQNKEEGELSIGR